jgi:mannosyltransferase OCH1-like enzyme
MFRYRLLYEKGGWWFDLDCFLVKPLTPLFDLDYVFGWETPTQVNAAVLKFPKNSEILDRLYKEYFEMDPDRWRPGFGIPLFTQYLKKFNLITKALPPEYFYPIYPGESQRLSNQAEETFILHLYASWEQAMKPVKELTLQNEIRSLKSQIDTLNRQVVSLTNQVHNLNNSLSLKIGRMIPFGETIRRAFVKDE